MKKKFFTIQLFLLLLIGSSFAQGTHPIVQSLIDNANIDSLTKYVNELSGEVATYINGVLRTINSRHKNHPDNDVAADYIKQKLESYGLNVTDQNFSSSGRNVFAEQTGTEFPDQKYMICAHYDDMPSSGLAPGADDNASGTAAVIEAARLFSGYDFPYTIIYALWDEEEQGLVGSDYYANNAAALGEDIMGVINLDMIAWEGNGDDKVRIHTRNDGLSNVISDRLVQLNTQYSIGLDTEINAPGITASDHASFWNEGYAALLIIEDDDGDFNPYYHTSNDLVDHFDFQFFLKCSQLAYATLSTFALNLKIDIEHVPQNTIDQSVDIPLSAEILSGLTLGEGIGSPHLYYRIDQGGGFGNYFPVQGTLAKSSTYNFVIPAQNLGTMVQYYIGAQDENAYIVKTIPDGGEGFNPPGYVPPVNSFQFYIGPYSLLLNDDCSSTSNWNASGGWNTTTEDFISSPTSITDSPFSEYPSNANLTLTLNNFVDLSNSVGAIIEFYTKWDIENNWDYGQLFISTDGSSWTPLEGNFTNEGTGSFQPSGQPLYDGSQNDWVLEQVDISSYAGSQIKLRFLLKSDSYIEEDGWYIDDLKITSYDVVPVELTVFGYTFIENQISLEWETASEINNYGFEIERALSSISIEGWEKIGFVGGNGTSSEKHNYIFEDKNFPSGKLSYRLKQIDYDGSFEYYGPITVENILPLNYSLEQNYPNPFNPETVIDYTIPQNSHVKLSVFNSLGQEIAVLVNENKIAGKYSVSFNGSRSGLNLPSGTYIYRIKAGEFEASRKMILVK